MPWPGPRRLHELVQCCLGLSGPQGHGHGLEHRRRCRERQAGRFHTALLCVIAAETEMTGGAQWTHAEPLS